MTSTSLLTLQAFPHLLLYSKCCAWRVALAIAIAIAIVVALNIAFVLHSFVCTRLCFFVFLTVAWYRRSFL